MARGESFNPREATLESCTEHVELFDPKTVRAVLHVRGLLT
jgi:hypothetical protein